MDGSTSLPDVLEAVVLGPEDRLAVVLPAHTTRDAFANAQAQLRATAFADRVLMVCGAEQLAVLRSPKAEGSTVGQCGDEYDVTVFGLAGGIDEYEVHRCHLAYGHTGMHSDGEATWSNQRDERYFCPTSGDVEHPTLSGFNVCCDRPDLHRPLTNEGSSP